MGVHVRKRGKKWGVWIYRDGKEKALIRWDTKKEAEAVATKLRQNLALIDMGVEDEQGAVALDSYGRLWLERNRSEWKRSTARAYEQIMALIIDYFGSRDLRTIRLKDVKAFDRHLKRTGRSQTGRSIKRRKNILTVLRGIFEEAKDEEIVEVNPVVGVHGRKRRRSGEKSRPVYRTLNLREMGMLFATTEEHEPQWLGPFQCAGLAGLRSGEIRGLKWGDIAFGASETDMNRYLHVQRNITETGFIEDSTKSGLDRKVDLPQELRRTLVDLQVREVMAGRGQPCDWVFCTSEGRFLPERTMQKAFKRILALAGLPDSRFHDLRHSFATIHLRELRSPIQWVSAQLGHSDIRITVNLYGHPEVETDVGVADRMAQAMAQTMSELDAQNQAESADQTGPIPDQKARGACKSLTHKPQYGGGGGNRSPSMPLVFIKLPALTAA